MAASYNTGNVAYSTDAGLTWQTETTGINVFAQEPYKIITTPGGYCFLFSEFCGEIRKRESFISGISFISDAISFLIYPIPFTSQTTISFAEQHKNATIRITDISGREIKAINFSGQQLLLEKMEMQNGIYFMTITDEKKNILTKKIIIE